MISRHFIGGLSLALSLLLSSNVLHAEAPFEQCARYLLDEAAARKTADDLRLHREAILRGYTLTSSYLDGYYERRILPYLDKMRFPEIKDPQVLYRCMLITAEELVAILSSGFDVRRSTWTAVGGPGVYFSTSPREASTYIFHNGGDAGKRLGIVFKVRRAQAMENVNDPIHNPSNSIYKSTASVSANEILGVSIWGQYGLEGLEEVLTKVSRGEVIPHETWTSQFDISVGR